MTFRSTDKPITQGPEARWIVPAILLLSLVFGRGPLAQQPQGQEPAGAEQLLAAKGRPESERTAIVRRLRTNDEAAVTEALLQELPSATSAAYRQALLQALGSVRRDRVLPVLQAAVIADDSTPIERSVAARGMAKQGDEGVHRLSDIASSSEVPLARTYAAIGLSNADSELAWTELAGLVQADVNGLRGTAIRYLQRAPALQAVVNARLAAAEDTRITTAANAVRQLAEGSHERAPALIREVCGRTPGAAGLAAVDLLYAVMTDLREDLYPAALRLSGEARRSAITGERALEELLPRLAAETDFIRFVRDQLNPEADPAEARISLELLADVPGEDITTEITQMASGRDPEVVSTALAVLSRRGDPSALPDLERLMKSRDQNLRLEALSTIHALRRGDPEWETELLDMTKKSSRRSKASVEFGLHLTLLADLGSEEALRYAWDALEHRDWTVRAAAIDFCRDVRSVDSVDKLIERIDEERGRLKEDLLDTLRSLTAMRFNAQGRWEDWWETNGKGFELIPADAFANESDSRSNRESRTVASYYGIPLVSDRVVFVVDISGSMSASFGTGETRTRLDEAKRQLAQVVGNAPEHFLFNVIAFETNVHPVFDNMQRMSGRRRKEALEDIEDLEPIGGTNLHDALQRAFAERELDTIYLLSDGAPSAGPITDPDRLAETVRRWNQTRRIRIHCISIGFESPLLRRIADESGGEYASSR